MAQDIFSGNYVSAFISDDVDNATINGTAFTQLAELANFPEIGVDRNIIEAINMGASSNRKLVGRATLPDIPLIINYIPQDTTHEKMKHLATTGKKFQLKLVYWVDETKTFGLAQVYNVYVANMSITGGTDAVVQLSFTLACDKLIVSGIVDTTGTTTLSDQVPEYTPIVIPEAAK